LGTLELDSPRMAVTSQDRLPFLLKSDCFFTADEGAHGSLDLWYRPGLQLMRVFRWQR